MFAMFTQILWQIQKELAELEGSTSDIIGRCEKALLMLTEADSRFKKLVITNGFATIAEEIMYFKTLRPALISEVIYYHRIYDIESRRPPGLFEELRKYYHRQCRKIKVFYEENREFIRYVRSRDTLFDEQLFTRHRITFRSERNSTFLSWDPQQTTGYDLKVAGIIASERLQKYLEMKMERKEAEDTSKPQSPVSDAPREPPKALEGNLLKSYQVQKMLRISEATLKRARQSGEIPFSKIGGTYYYDEALIRQILADRMFRDKWKDK